MEHELPESRQPLSGACSGISMTPVCPCGLDSARGVFATDI
jgi:hypothetical protein